MRKQVCRARPHETSIVYRPLIVFDGVFLGEEEQSMLLNELMMDLFAGHGFVDHLRRVRKFIGSGHLTKA